MMLPCPLCGIFVDTCLQVLSQFVSVLLAETVIGASQYQVTAQPPVLSASATAGTGGAAVPNWNSFSRYVRHSTHNSPAFAPGMYTFCMKCDS